MSILISKHVLLYNQQYQATMFFSIEHVIIQNVIVQPLTVDWYTKTAGYTVFFTRSHELHTLAISVYTRSGCPVSG